MTHLERCKEGRIKGAGFLPVSAERRDVPIILENQFTNNERSGLLEQVMEDETNNVNNLGARRKTKPGQQEAESNLQNETFERRVIPIKLDNGDILLPNFTKLEDSDPYVWTAVDDRENEHKKIVPNNSTNQLWREPSLRYTNTSQNVYNSLKRKTKHQENCKLLTPSSNEKIIPPYRRRSLESQHQNCGGDPPKDLSTSGATSREQVDNLSTSRSTSGGQMRSSKENLLKSRVTSREHVRSNKGNNVQHIPAITSSPENLPSKSNNNNISENNYLKNQKQRKYPLKATTGTAAGQIQNGELCKNPSMAENDEDPELKSNLIRTEEACYACDACTQTVKLDKKDACIIM